MNLEERIVHIDAEPAYDVLIGHGLLQDTGRLVLSVATPCRVTLVSDDAVAALYAARVQDSLSRAGFDVVLYVFPHGESSKSTERMIDLVNFMSRNAMTRSDLVVALGGGVTGDLAGLAASLYLRGVRLIQIPTTLLAAVDSSVGGKTAVNLESGKNLCGSFWQPSLVICDVDVFETLPEEIFRDGLAESIKYAVLKDPDLFSSFEQFVRGDDLTEIVASCVKMKNDYIVHDIRDHGERQFLNLGHTPAHAIEVCSAFEMSHGHAVAAGMMIMARASEAMCLATQPFAARLEALLVKHGLPVRVPYSAEELARVACQDKKRRGASITLVMPLQIGHCVLYPVPVESLVNIFEVGLK